MSFFSNVLSYALAAAKSQAQTMALKAVQAGANQLTTAIATHAPDVATLANAKIQEGISHAVAGILSQTAK